MTSATRGFLLVCCVLMGSCAGWRSYTEGREMMAQGDSVGALAKLEQAVKAAPNNYEYRQTYEQDKALAVERWVGEGDVFRTSGDLDKAEAVYRRALRYDPANKTAQAGLVAIDQTRKNLAIIRGARAAIDAGELDQAEQTLKAVIAQDP